MRRIRVAHKHPVIAPFAAPNRATKQRNHEWQRWNAIQSIETKRIPLTRAEENDLDVDDPRLTREIWRRRMKTFTNRVRDRERQQRFNEWCRRDDEKARLR
jgi:hypothetical protein